MSRLGDMIRAKIDLGVLPLERPEKLFAGYGEGEPCAACGAPILRDQVEWSIRMRDRVTHRFHIGCHGLWEAELRKRRVLQGERRRAPALETVVIQARRRPEGLCLPCLSDACELPIDVVSAVVMELQEVMSLRLQGTCPVCRDDRLLIRF